MNQDTQRNYLIKLLGVSLAGAGVWFTIVGPKLNAVDDLEQTLENQASEISNGEEAIRLHSADVEKTIQQVEHLQSELASQLDVNREVNVHKHLQDAAEQRGLTVSRVEPLRETVTIRKSSVDQKKIQMLTKEFRLECIGAYSSIVGYLDDLRKSTNLSKVSSFRIVPVSSQQARMILQVEVYQLVDAPDVFTESMSTPPTTISEAGGPSDDT